MRVGLSLAMVGMVLCGTGVQALAQLQPQQQQPSYVYGGGNTNTIPLYNGATNYTQQTNGAAYYNNGANLQMLPMQQLTAGKNAPSYSYGSANGSQQPYNFNSYNGGLDPNASGGLTPDQARMIRAQRDAQAQAYQAQYMQELAQRDQNYPYAQPAQQPQQAGSMYQGSQFNQLYADNAQPKPQVKRKVIYNQLNNPLVEPPRLFNPDK